MGIYLGKQPRRSSSLKERIAFYSVPHVSGCRLWTGKKDKDGYGKITYRGRYLRAHRAAWEDANGPIPDGKQVLHECDVRACVEDDHLFLGTNAINMADRNAKGRQARGTKIWGKLDPDKVRRIRAWQGSAIALAKELGVSPGMIYSVKDGTSWSHVT